MPPSYCVFLAQTPSRHSVWSVGAARTKRVRFDDEENNRLLRSWARTYAALGIPVFPCKPYDKQPLTAHGFHDATTKPDQIDEWWSDYPNANVAS